jgi:LCP family protein required for cell wall assembly
LRGHGTLRGVALTLSAVLLFGVSAVAAFGQRLDSNLDTVDISALVGGGPGSDATQAPPDPEDPSAGRAVNILVLGSDYRDAATKEQEGVDTQGMRADTTIVVHISADRTRVEAVSIPRDSLVKISSCVMSNGKTTKARSKDLINSAFATGWDNGGDVASAAACAVRTVQDNTGLTIDHFVVVDFAGFQSMVNAIGGVDICIPQDMHDSVVGLNLAAGQQVLGGEDAFKFARSRHNNLGNGSDIDRIGNQQRLVAAIANQVLSRDVLTDVTKLVPFLTAATASLTTDMSLPTMTGMAYNMRGIRANGITFMTIPWQAAPSDPNRVVWTAEAKTVWQNMVEDLPITSSEPGATATETAGATTGAPTSSATGTADATTAPIPTQTKEAGKEAFTPADVTAVCS